MIYKVHIVEVEANKRVHYPKKLLIQCHPKILDKEIKKELGLRSIIIGDKWAPVEIYHATYVLYPLFDVLSVVLAYQEVESLTKSALSKRIGITRPTLDTLYNNGVFSKKTLLKIEEELGVTLSGNY